MELRAVAGAGGRYTHFANGLITLHKINEGVYKVFDLGMFYRSYGWCAVLRGGEMRLPEIFGMKSKSFLMNPRLGIQLHERTLRVEF